MFRPILSFLFLFFLLIIEINPVFAREPICAIIGWSPPDPGWSDIGKAVRNLKPKPKVYEYELLWKLGDSHTVINGLVPTAARICLGTNSNPIKLDFGNSSRNKSSIIIPNGGCVDLTFSYLRVQASCYPGETCTERKTYVLLDSRNRGCPSKELYNTHWSEMNAFVADPLIPTELIWKAWIRTDRSPPPNNGQPASAVQRAWLALGEEAVTLNVCSETKGIKLDVSDDPLGAKITNSIITTTRCTRVRGKSIWIDRANLPSDIIKVTYRRL